ncbi:MAG: metal-dependent transcriptional regulator [Chloroflexota bacterium]
MLEKEKLVEEILEALWTEAAEKDVKERTTLTSPHQPEPLLGTPAMEEALREAEARGLVLASGESLWLTERGRDRARDIVRRHRLAERLFHDVLDIGSEKVESSACELEHQLSPDATNSICILLGHPTVCPHGKPIPGGECCQQHLEEGRPLVMPATKLRPREEATVAYLGVRARDRLDQLAALGLLPGTGVQLVQRHPSHVLRFGETELALDESILKEVYVRRTGAAMPRARRHGRRWGWHRKQHSVTTGANPLKH